MPNPHVACEVPDTNKRLIPRTVVDTLVDELRPPLPAVSESAKAFALIALDELAACIGRARLRTFLLQVVSAL